VGTEKHGALLAFCSFHLLPVQNFKMHPAPPIACESAMSTTTRKCCLQTKGK
jgi:hypothetical protein